MHTEGIKSKDRVQEYGEVFTPDNIVNDMLDLVDKELDKDDLWDYIDKTFLEPACGNGNFLIRILDRKLEKVQMLPKDSQEIGLIHALCSIYGLDIQADNVKESQDRMLELIKNGKVSVLNQGNEKIEWHFKPIELSDKLEKAIKEILKINIQTGNFLTGKYQKRNRETNEDILITEYTWDGDKVKRNEIALANISNESINKDIPENTIDYHHYLDIKHNKRRKVKDLEEW